MTYRLFLYLAVGLSCRLLWTKHNVELIQQVVVYFLKKSIVIF